MKFLPELSQRVTLLHRHYQDSSSHSVIISHVKGRNLTATYSFNAKTSRNTAAMPERRSSRLAAINATAPKTSIASHFATTKSSNRSTKKPVANGTFPDDLSKEPASKPAPKRKASNVSVAADRLLVEPPSKSRRKITTASLVPSNTTPRQVTQLAETANALETLASVPVPASDRVVDSTLTNAPLIALESSELVERTPVVETREEEVELTTGNVLDKALMHLIAVEPKLKPIIEKHHCKTFSEEGLKEAIDPWVSLVSSIIGQQVSGAAAKSIKNKFIALFNPGEEDVSKHVFPQPSAVSTTDITTLRTAGLSQRKAEYIQGLGQKFASGELTTDFLMKAPYEEIFQKLIEVRGLGKWSVEMFACFGLKRLDVFSTGDLGVQ